MKNITANSAVLAAVAYANLTLEEIGELAVRRTDGLYEICFASDWTLYDCFVDENDGEVLGFDCRPVPEHMLLIDAARLSA